MPVSAADNAAERRQVDRRQSTQSVAVDRRQSDRRTVGNAGAGAAVQAVTAAPKTSASFRGTDTATMSPDARQEQEESSRGFGSFLKSFEGNFDDLGDSQGAMKPLDASGSSSGNSGAGALQTITGRAGGEETQVGPASAASGNGSVSAATKPEAEQASPEEERRKLLESTGKTLQGYSDFTTGGDGFTTRDEYQAIADGKRNEDFTKYLKEKHPDWSDDQLSKEVKSLQDSSRGLVQDKGAFDFYDNATNGGETDQKISPTDLASGRLRNDTSKDFPPRLSVEEINQLHEMNPALGNEAISNKYYHQAQELNKLMGGDEKSFNATWPAYGSQASNSAGVMIRDDGVPGSDQISDAVAAGNRKVFADIAPHYDSYIEAAKKPGFNYDEWVKNEFPDRPNGVPPLLEASRQPGFDVGKWNDSLPEDYKKNPGYLRESFDFLDAARTTEDADQKQELLLGSNVLAGRHEQGYLQSDIEKATAPISGSGLERSVLEAAVDKDPIFYMPNGKGSGPADQYKVDQRYNGTAPTSLQTIDDPAVRSALAVGLGDRKTPDSIRGDDLIAGTGQENWADLDGRMKTIAGLMVAGQTDPRMGEYILDYDQPAGLSTTGNLGDMGENILEQTTGTLSDAWNKTTGMLAGLFD